MRAERVQQFLVAAAKLAEIVADGREAFEASWRQSDLAAYQLVLVGEAAGHLSEGFVAARPGR